jgi:hypothetical protein
MQISRLILWASVTATLLFPFALLAQDANADDKLQEALKQKMKDLESAPPATQPPPTAPQQPANVAPAPTKPAAPAMAPVAAPAEATNPQDDAKMQDALHRKINELDAEQPAAPVVPPPPPATSKSKSEPVYQPFPGSNPSPAVVTHPAKAEPKTVEAQPATPAAQQASRDAEIAKAVADANTRQAKDNQVPKADTTMTKPGQKSVAAARTPSTLPPLQGPPSSLNSSQQARLQALDQQYMSDLITSEQYHARRAKIIAEP